MGSLNNHIIHHESIPAASHSAHGFRYVIRPFLFIWLCNTELLVNIFVGLCTIFSVIVLGLSAHLTNVSSEAHAVTDNEVMGLVTSILSILIFPAL